MKTKTIRTAMDAHLRALGFAEGSWSWIDRPNTLIILVGGKVRHLRLKPQMPKWALIMEMGRCKGWAEALDIEPPKTIRPYVNGAAAHTEQLSLSV
jgi:hypothetical protein